MEANEDITHVALKMFWASLVKVPGVFFLDLWWTADGPYNLLPKSYLLFTIFNSILSLIVFLNGIFLMILPPREAQRLYLLYVSTGLIIYSFYLRSQTQLSGGWSNLTISTLRLLAEAVSLTLLGRSPTSIPNFFWKLWILLIILTVFATRRIQIITREDVVLILYTYHLLKIHLNCIAFIVRLYEAVHLSDFVEYLFVSFLSPIHFSLYFILRTSTKMIFMEPVVDPLLGRGLVVNFLEVYQDFGINPITQLSSAAFLTVLWYFVICCVQITLTNTIFLPDEVSLPLEIILLLCRSCSCYLIQVTTFTLDMKSVQFLNNIRLYNLAYLISYLFFLIQSILLVVKAMLPYLSTSINTSLVGQMRMVVTCAGLLAIPCYVSYKSFNIFPNNIWLISILPNLILTDISLLNLILSYIFYMWESTREERFDGMDTQLFIVHVGSKILETVTGTWCIGLVFRLANRESLAWDAAMIFIVVEGYFLVWWPLKAIEQSLDVRRRANEMEQSLRTVGSIELNQNPPNLCPICHVEITNYACATPCNHIFHRACLRKWLYISIRCPMCQTEINA